MRLDFIVVNKSQKMNLHVELPLRIIKIYHVDAISIINK